MTDEKVKVLYIAGMPRSGSTVLGRLLGEPRDAVHVGEIGLFSVSHFLASARCECLRTVSECDFWSAVLERAFGGLDALDLESLQQTRSEYRLRGLPQLLLPRTADQTKRLNEYLAVLSALYEAIREVSGAKVIVDGSKDVLYGHLLSQVPTIDLHIIHLIRDSRAVAFSHQRLKRHLPFTSDPGHLPQLAPWQTALHWNAVTLLMSAMRNPRFLLRYEDFVADPQEALRRIWDLTGEPMPSLEFLQRPSLHLHQGHTVAGNPDRFQSEIKIKPDLEWQQKMSPANRCLVTAMTLPLLLRYGYLNPRSSRRPHKSIQPSRVL